MLLEHKATRQEKYRIKAKSSLYDEGSPVKRRKRGHCPVKRGKRRADT